MINLMFVLTLQNKEFEFLERAIEDACKQANVPENTTKYRKIGAYTLLQQLVTTCILLRFLNLTRGKELLV